VSSTAEKKLLVGLTPGGTGVVPVLVLARPALAEAPTCGKRAARDTTTSARFFDASNGDLNVHVLRERDLDQSLELWIVEQIPPLFFDDRSCVSADHAPSRRYCGIRTFIIGTYHTGGETQSG
jgi:hypothetical protein